MEDDGLLDLAPTPAGWSPAKIIMEYDGLLDQLPLSQDGVLLKS